MFTSRFFSSSSLIFNRIPCVQSTNCSCFTIFFTQSSIRILSTFSISTKIVSLLFLLFVLLEFRWNKSHNRNGCILLVNSNKNLKNNCFKQQQIFSPYICIYIFDLIRCSSTFVELCSSNVHEFVCTIRLPYVECWKNEARWFNAYTI